MILRLPSLLLWPLLWLTLLALPARAAGAVPPCHHVQVQAQVQAGVTHAAAPDGTIPQVQARTCARHGAGSGHDHGRCVGCPACCAGVALAPAQPGAPPAAGPAFVAIPFYAGHVPSVDPALPERPPRHPFA